MKHLKVFGQYEVSEKFFLKKLEKDPREIANIFSDVFTELDDMGAWVSYSNGDRLIGIESNTSAISTEKNQIYFEIKTRVDSDDIQVSNSQEKQIEIYKYLESNINKLINRFEDLSKYKIKKVRGSVSFELNNENALTWDHITHTHTSIKTNLLGNRFRFENLDSLRKKNKGDIGNIILYFFVSI